VYLCGDGYANLCRIQPDGSGQTNLTSDGRSGGPFYASPSLSRDGTRLAFNFANQTYVVEGDPSRRGAAVAQAAALAALRPDAAQLATVESFPVQTMLTGISGPTFFTTFVPFLVTYNLATAERTMNRRLPGAVAWAGDHVVTAGQATSTKKQTLCLLKPDNITCERQLAQDNGRDLTDPTVSPDNTLLAVASCAQPDRQACSLAVYGMTGGARLRELTAGPNDTSPAWSPDGTNIAFTRAGDLFVTAADGSPGSERLLARGGRSATWGGSASALGDLGPPAPPEPVTPLPPPTEPMPPPPPDSPPAAPPAADAVQVAVATAADQLQVPSEQLVVLSVEQKDWSDTSLGCPEPDRAYAQIIVPGYLIVVATDDGATELQIHTDQGQRAVSC
jgi:hypothetical protein